MSVVLDRIPSARLGVGADEFQIEVSYVPVGPDDGLTIIS
jgi:hypothetical protein